MGRPKGVEANLSARRYRFSPPKATQRPSKFHVNRFDMPENTMAVLGKENSGKAAMINALIGRDVLPTNDAIKHPILITYRSCLQEGQALLESSVASHFCPYGALVASVVAADLACPPHEIVQVILPNGLRTDNVPFLYLPARYAVKGAKQIGQCEMQLDGYYAGIQCIAQEDVDAISQEHIDSLAHEFEHPQHSIIVITNPKNDKMITGEKCFTLGCCSLTTTFFFAKPDWSNADDLRKSLCGTEEKDDPELDE